MDLESGFQITDLGGIARRRGKMAGLVALGLLLASYWVAMALPNSYTSYATVLVEPQSVAEDLVKAGVARRDLNERLHLMTARILSRPRLSRIIDELELYHDESGYLLREEVIDLMRARIKVEPVVSDLAKKARTELEINEFRIFFEDYDSLLARDVAQRLANDFIETHIEERVEVSQKSLEFIQGELDRLATRIRAVEADVKEVKNDNPGRLPDDLHANQRRLERAMSDLAIAQRLAAAAASDEAFFRSQAATAKLATSSSDSANPVRRLDMLKLQHAEYMSRGFTDKHPDIINIRNEIQRVITQINSDRESAADSPALTPMARQVEAEMQRAALRRAAAIQEVERLQATSDEITELLAQTPAVEEQLDALNRQYEHLFESFQDFSNRHLEATVQAQLERRQLGEQFRVLESAFEAPQPSAPNRLLIIALGAVFGIALGGGAGMLLEVIDTSPHDPRQLQTQVQLPVLASIPEIWLESDRVRLRYSRIRAAFATAGVVVFAVLGGAANYLWVNGAPRFLEPLLSGDAAAEATAETEG